MQGGLARAPTSQLPERCAEAQDSYWSGINRERKKSLNRGAEQRATSPQQGAPPKGGQKRHRESGAPRKEAGTNKSGPNQGVGSDDPHTLTRGNYNVKVNASRKPKRRRFQLRPLGEPAIAELGLPSTVSDHRSGRFSYDLSSMFSKPIHTGII